MYRSRSSFIAPISRPSYALTESNVDAISLRQIVVEMQSLVLQLNVERCCLLLKAEADPTMRRRIRSRLQATQSVAAAFRTQISYHVLHDLGLSDEEISLYFHRFDKDVAFSLQGISKSVRQQSKRRRVNSRAA